MRCGGLEVFSISNGDEGNGECLDRDPDEPVDGKIQEPKVVNERDVLVQLVALDFEELVDIECRDGRKLPIDLSATGSKRHAATLK